MIEIKKAGSGDFDRVYPLLKELNSTAVKEDGWRRLFTRQWDNQQDSFGYMIVDNNDTVGFIGTLFSERTINNRRQKFCNLTSWIVKKEYRGSSISLIFPILQLKEYTVTVFTASPVTSSVLKAFGYREAAGKRFVIPALFSGFSAGGSSVEYDLDAIRNSLNETDSRIFSDHLKFRCCHIMIRAKEGYCYIIFRKRSMRKIPVANIHYISDREIFLKYITGPSFSICRRFKVFGLVVDGRYLKGRRPRHSIALRPSGPILYKSESVQEQDIDTLYSELFVLDI